MTSEPSTRFPAFRIVLLIVVLVNLILAIVLIAELRQVKEKVASLPPDLASKRDVAMLRPLRVPRALRRLPIADPCCVCFELPQRSAR